MPTPEKITVSYSYKGTSAERIVDLPPGGSLKEAFETHLKYPNAVSIKSTSTSAVVESAHPLASGILDLHDNGGIIPGPAALDASLVPKELPKPGTVVETLSVRIHGDTNDTEDPFSAFDEHSADNFSGTSWYAGAKFLVSNSINPDSDLPSISPWLMDGSPLTAEDHKYLQCQVYPPIPAAAWASAKYGNPVLSLSEFRFPVVEGDRKGAECLREGPGSITSTSYDGSGTVTLSWGTPATQPYDPEYFENAEVGPLDLAIRPFCDSVYAVYFNPRSSSHEISYTPTVATVTCVSSSGDVLSEPYQDVPLTSESLRSLFADPDVTIARIGAGVSYPDIDSLDLTDNGVSDSGGWHVLVESSGRNIVTAKTIKKNSADSVPSEVYSFDIGSPELSPSYQNFPPYTSRIEVTVRAKPLGYNDFIHVPTGLAQGVKFIPVSDEQLTALTGLTTEAIYRASKTSTGTRLSWVTLSEMWHPFTVDRHPNYVTGCLPPHTPPLTLILKGVRGSDGALPKLRFDRITDHSHRHRFPAAPTRESPGVPFFRIVQDLEIAGFGPHVVAPSDLVTAYKYEPNGLAKSKWTGHNLCVDSVLGGNLDISRCILAAGPVYKKGHSETLGGFFDERARLWDSLIRLSRTDPYGSWPSERVYVVAEAYGTKFNSSSNRSLPALFSVHNVYSSSTTSSSDNVLSFHRCTFTNIANQLGISFNSSLPEDEMVRPVFGRAFYEGCTFALSTDDTLDPSQIAAAYAGAYYKEARVWYDNPNSVNLNPQQQEDPGMFSVMDSKNRNPYPLRCLVHKKPVSGTDSDFNTYVQEVSKVPDGVHFVDDSPVTLDGVPVGPKSPANGGGFYGLVSTSLNGMGYPSLMLLQGSSSSVIDHDTDLDRAYPQNRYREDPLGVWYQPVPCLHSPLRCSPRGCRFYPGMQCAGSVDASGLTTGGSAPSRGVPSRMLRLGSSPHIGEWPLDSALSVTLKPGTGEVVKQGDVVEFRISGFDSWNWFHGSKVVALCGTEEHPVEFVSPELARFTVPFVETPSSVVLQFTMSDTSEACVFPTGLFLLNETPTSLVLLKEAPSLPSSGIPAGHSVTLHLNTISSSLVRKLLASGLECSCSPAFEGTLTEYQSGSEPPEFEWGTDREICVETLVTGSLTDFYDDLRTSVTAEVVPRADGVSLAVTFAEPVSVPGHALKYPNSNEPYTCTDYNYIVHESSILPERLYRVRLNFRTRGANSAEVIACVEIPCV